MERGSQRMGVTIALAAVLLVAACGGSSKSSSSSSSPGPGTSSSSSSSASSSSSRTAEELAADQQTAQSMVLKIGDFPSGWKAKARPPSTADTPEAKAAVKTFADCLGVDPALVDDNDPTEAKARSDKFVNGDQEVDSTATVPATVEHKDEILGAFRKPEAVGCFENFINAAFKSSLSSSSLPPGTQIGDISVSAGDISGVHGDAINFQATIPITAQGQSINFFSDTLFVLKGRATFDFTFDNVNAPFPADLATQLANTSIDRAPDS